MSVKHQTNKPLPTHTSDEASEAFTDTADLTEYDLSGFTPTQFTLAKNDARLEMRIPARQLEALKAEADRRGIPYTRLARALLDEGLQKLVPQ
jgi:predicted DNA binding CopG/RHH family protein